MNVYNMIIEFKEALTEYGKRKNASYERLFEND